MKVFLSHAHKDAALADALVEALSAHGVEGWSFDREIVPGDNWAKKMGQALHDADLIVFLLTPGAMEASSIRHDVEFALSSRKHEDRVYTLFVGPTAAASRDVPWILLSLPYRQIGSRKDLSQAIADIVNLPRSVRKTTVHA